MFPFLYRDPTQRQTRESRSLSFSILACPHGGSRESLSSAVLAPGGARNWSNFQMDLIVHH